MNEQTEGKQEEGQVEGGEGEVQSLDPEVEKEARLYGWDPDRYPKDDPNWVDALTFIQKGKEINPILQKNNEKLLREIAKQEKQIQQLDLTIQQFGKMYTEMQKSAYERAIAEAKQAKTQATRDGDVELAEQLSDHIDDLKEKAKEVKAPTVDPQTVNQDDMRQAFQEWHAGNDWYGKDEALTRLADGVGHELMNKHPILKGSSLLFEKISQELKRLVPEKFGNKLREKGSPVSGSAESRPSAQKKGSSYADMPKEGKDSCERFIAHSGISGKAVEAFRADFAKEYFKQQKA